MAQIETNPFEKNGIPRMRGQIGDHGGRLRANLGALRHLARALSRHAGHRERADEIRAAVSNVELRTVIVADQSRSYEIQPASRLNSPTRLLSAVISEAEPHARLVEPLRNR
jgi:hypothetical protein